MNYLLTIVLSLLTFVGAYKYLPMSYFDSPSTNLGSTITTIAGTDTLSSSRSVINTNFANLNADKLESGGTATTLTIGTLTLTNPLAIGQGGTGKTSFTAGLVYGNGTTLTNISTTSISLSSGLTNTGTLGSQIGGSSLTLKQFENRSFSYSTTTWVGTTTIPLGVGYGETWNNMKCAVTPNGATVNADFYINSGATTHLPFFTASSTVGIVGMGATVNTSGATTSVAIGAPSGSPTTLMCTLNDTI
jgi:hypothetical protein